MRKSPSPLRVKRKSREAPIKVADFAPDSMIELRGVVKRFTNAAGVFTVLKDIDLTINRGEFVSIVGKSGSGKSTLLNMVTGIDHPTEGQVVVNGTDKRLLTYALTMSGSTKELESEVAALAGWLTTLSRL